MIQRSGVVIAGGGTGGHVVPGLAIARALVSRGMPAEDIHWIGSSRGMEVVDVPQAGFGLTVLPGRGIERKVTLQNISNIFGIMRAVPAAIRIVRKRRPAVVVCLGGYAAVPASLAAVVLRVPLVIQEQNARPSLANRLVSRRARFSAVLSEGTGLRNEIVTGNPLRDEVVEAIDSDIAMARGALGVADRTLLILAFGGSLGSRRINLATLGLAEKWSDRGDIAIHHVIGKRDWEKLQPRIRSAMRGAIHYQAVEYEHHMEKALVAADVAVCRSGGMTVSEIAALGVASILVPLPIAPNDAQRHNAAALVAAGAAVVVEDEHLDGDHLAAELTKLFDGDLGAMTLAAKMVGKPHAGDHVAQLIEDIVHG